MVYSCCCDCVGDLDEDDSKGLGLFSLGEDGGCCVDVGGGDDDLEVDTNGLLSINVLRGLALGGEFDLDVDTNGLLSLNVDRGLALGGDLDLDADRDDDDAKNGLVLILLLMLLVVGEDVGIG